MNWTIDFRPFRRTDAAFVNELRTRDAMERLIGGARRPVSPERDEKWIDDIIIGDSQTTVYFAVTAIGTDDIIGYTSVSDIDYRNGGCFWSGIKLNPDLAPKGAGTQVALKILTYVFDELRMERCTGLCLEHHAAALRMMEKAGFKREGLLRNALFKNGEYNNQWLMSVLREEYLVIKKSSI